MSVTRNESDAPLAIEQVGDELVVFDPARMHYHTLNGSAVAVWAACDGAQDFDSAVAAAMNSNPALTPAQAIQTVEELEELGLVEVTHGRFGRRISRRVAVKLAAAAFVGAVGLPIIVSITVPSSQAAATGCPSGYVCMGHQCCPCAGRECTCGGPVCTGDGGCLGGLTCISGICGIPC